MIDAAPLLLFALLSGLASGAPALRVEDSVGCVDQTALAAGLPDAPPGTRVELDVHAPTADVRIAAVRVQLADAAVPALDRRLEVAAHECGDLAAVVVLIVERYLADLPATAWDVRPSALEPAPRSDRTSTPTAQPAAVASAPSPDHERPPPAPWMPLRLHIGGEVQVDAGMAGTQPLHRIRAAATSNALWRLGWGRFGVYAALGAEVWEPVVLPPGFVSVGGAAADAGLLVGLELAQLRAGLRAGGLWVQGAGFDRPLSELTPSAELVSGLDFAFSPIRVRLEIAVPLLRPVFQVRNFTGRQESPSFWFGVAVGGKLG